MNNFALTRKDSLLLLPTAQTDFCTLSRFQHVLGKKGNVQIWSCFSAVTNSVVLTFQAEFVTQTENVSDWNIFCSCRSLFTKNNWRKRVWRRSGSCRERTSYLHSKSPDEQPVRSQIITLTKLHCLIHWWMEVSCDVLLQKDNVIILQSKSRPKSFVGDLK